MTKGLFFATHLLILTSQLPKHGQHYIILKPPQWYSRYFLADEEKTNISSHHDSSNNLHQSQMDNIQSGPASGISTLCCSTWIDVARSSLCLVLSWLTRSGAASFHTMTVRLTQGTLSHALHHVMNIQIHIHVFPPDSLKNSLLHSAACLSLLFCLCHRVVLSFWDSVCKVLWTWQKMADTCGEKNRPGLDFICSIFV